MAISIFQVDAFSDRKFAGNPAAVCLLDEAADAGWMQRVAQETGLPATAFLHQQEGGYALRWFTPTIELPLCGHGTLASAHVLFESGRVPRNAHAQFYTQAGTLSAWLDEGWIQLDFPAQPVSKADEPADLAAALGDVTISGVYRNAAKYMVELGSEEQVRNARPNFAALRDIPADGVVITSAASTPGYDFVSRYFAPNHGIDEDAVTGSAHTALAPFWTARLGRNPLVGYQASARGGTVRVKMNDDRVQLGGQAITVMRGELA